MTLQADLHFTLDERGWSERYYLDPSEPDLLPTLDRLVKIRLPLLAHPASLTRGRIADLAAPKLARRFAYNRVGKYVKGQFILGLDKTQEFYAAPADTAIGIGWAGASGGNRMLWIGGFPDQGKLNPGNPERVIMAPDFRFRLDAFRDALQAPDLNLQIRSLKASASLETPVERIAVSEQGLYLITTSDNHGLEPGQTVRLIGSRGSNLTRMRGLRKVIETPSVKTLVIDRGPLPEKGPVVYTGGCKVATTGYTFEKAEWRETDAFSLVFVQTLKLAPVVTRKVHHYFYFHYTVASKLRGSGQPPRRGRASNRK